MRPVPALVRTAALLAVVFPALASAAPADAAASPESATRARVEQLEAQLERARKTVADLEAELQAARREAGTAPPGIAAGAPAVAPVAATDGGADASRRSVASTPESPVSITRLDTTELVLGGVQDITRLEYLVPGLRYGQTGHDARLSMRGARTNSIGPEAGSVVGVFEDGVYIPTSTMRLDSFVDVERVDVLRGPQITDFGAHAYAGAISIVNNRPDLAGFSGRAEGENSLPDRTRWRLSLNVPIGDTLAFRVAGLSESRSGWIDNRVVETDSDDLNDRKEQTLRSSLLWQPTGNFSVLLWRKYQDENGTGTAPWGYQQIGAYVDGVLQPGHQFAPEGYTPDRGPWDVYRNFISAAEFEHELDTLDINWDMGFASLQWLSNYMKFEGVQTYDSDYSDRGESTSSPFSGWRTEDTGWSSELRLSGGSESGLGWLLGLYGSERDADWGWLQTSNGVSFQPESDPQGEFSAETQAAFAQLSYALGERFTLSGGLRWQEDSKTLKTGEDGNWDDILWKLALQYDLSDRTMSYLSVSTGFVAGGINTAPGVNPRWEPETLTAYEAGLRTALLDGELMLDLAAWYNDFEDVQSQSFLAPPQPGLPETIEYTGNGGAVEASGLEAKIHWSPTPAFSLATNIAYTDAQFGDYTAPNLAGLGEIAGHSQGLLLSFENWRPALSPKWVVGVQTSYTFTFDRWGTLTPYLQDTYASDYYAADINLPGTLQDSHHRFDFRLIWEPIDRFQIQFYALNYDDTESLNWVQVYNPAARPDIATLQANWNNPSTQGILFNYRF